MTQHPKHRGSVSLDGLGAGVSLACALHCAAIPLIFGLIPSLQLALQSWDSEWQALAQWLLWTHEAERVFVSLVMVFASTVLIRGFLKHRQSAPLVIGAFAALGLIGGAFGHWHSDDLLHVALQVGGGLALAAAHIVNLRCLRRAGLHSHQTYGNPLIYPLNKKGQGAGGRCPATTHDLTVPRRGSPAACPPV